MLPIGRLLSVLDYLPCCMSSLPRTSHYIMVTRDLSSSLLPLVIIAPHGEADSASLHERLSLRAWEPR